MKKSFFLLFITIAVCSCMKSVSDPIYNNEKQHFVIHNNDQMSSNNAVSKKDLDVLLSTDIQTLKSAVPEYDLTVYTGDESDTLLYIVNFKNGGWKIYSSDKRTPAILAEGDKGYFSLEEGNPATAIWVDCMSKDIARVKRASDQELSFTAEEIRANRQFWSGSQPIFPPESEGQEEPILRDPPPGHWEVDYYTQQETYDSIDHLVAKWSQREPYNEYSPYYVGSTDRALAGCVAIAGAQVLHYLHYKLGQPAQMCSTGYCVGDINNYFRLFDDFNSTIWASMDTCSRAGQTTSTAEGLLIGYVGELVNMHYCAIGSYRYSWAIPANLKTDVFEYFGINCTHGDYNENYVKNNLQQQLPIIVSASDLLVPLDGDIHCFVIDGYLRKRTMYCSHYYYVIDGPVSPYEMYDIPPHEYTTYTYSEPYISKIKINWGWSTQWNSSNPVNDGWYSLTAGWTVSNGGTYDYNYYIKMIYDFSVN